MTALWDEEDPAPVDWPTALKSILDRKGPTVMPLKGPSIGVHLWAFGRGTLLNAGEAYICERRNALVIEDRRHSSDRKVGNTIAEVPIERLLALLQHEGEE